MQKGENREVKKIVLLVFTSILFLSCVEIEFQLIRCVGATDTWTVEGNGPAEFSRIQDAVDASTSGDVINFKPGKYYDISEYGNH